MIVLTEILCSI